MLFLSRLLILVSSVLLTACGGTVEKVVRMSSMPGAPAPDFEERILELAESIQALGAEVDPEEAARAARISYEHAYFLAIDYQITDPALVHNVKVNLGLRPRGLCKHWAEDMERRLKSENFETLTIHRAIGALVGVDHSTTIISKRGDDLHKGIVVDPWRDGGRLTWIHTADDMVWGWVPRFEALDQMAIGRAQSHGMDTMIYIPESAASRCVVLGERVAGAKSTTNLAPCLSADYQAKTAALAQ